MPESEHAQPGRSTRLNEGIFDLLCTATREGCFVSLDGDWEGVLGWHPDALIGQRYLDLLHPEDLEATREAAVQLFSGAPVTRFVNRYRSRSGSYRWFEWYARVADDGLIHASIRDITCERRQLAHARQVEAISGIGSWELDPSMQALIWSPGTYTIFGLDPERFRPELESALALFDPQDEPVLRAAIAELIAQGTPFDLTLAFMTAAGEKRFGRATGGAEHDGRTVTTVFGTFQDITELYTAREEARRAREELQSAIEALPDGFVLFDKEDRIVAFNEQHRRLYPSMADAVQLGAHFEDLVRLSLKRGNFPEAEGREEEWMAERLAAHALPRSLVEQPIRDGRWLRIIETETRDGGRVGMRVDITDLKRQEQRLADIIAGTNVGTWEWDMTENVMSYNDRWAEIIGYRLEEILPATIDFWRRISHPDDIARARACLEAHFRGETEFYECEVRLRHKDGHWVWVLDRGRVSQRDENGKPLRMSGTHLDITERKQAEIELEHQEQLLRGLFELSPVGIALNDFETGAFIDVNDALLASTGYTREEFLRLSYWDVTPEGYAEAEKEQLDSMQRTGRFGPFEKEYINKDGHRYPVLLNGMLVHDSMGRKLIWTIIEDISARKTLEAALIAERDFLAQINATSVSAITALDADGAIVFANDEAERVLGIAHSDVEGRSFDAPEWRITDLDGGPFPMEDLPFIRVMKTGEPVYDVRHAIVWPDGRRRVLSINAAPLKQTNGTRARVVCSVTDITERMANEARILSQAREDALTGLANRAALMEQLEHFAGDRRERSGSGAFILLDLDYFKEINDSLGHIAGDELLNEIAHRLRESVRDGDLVARLGGDEFAILLRDMRREEDIETVAETLLARIREPFMLHGRALNPSMSIGIALRPAGGASVEELYRNADSALYHAKATGRNTWSLFNADLRARIARRKQIGHAIEEAVVGGGLEIAFQPQIRLDTGEHSGFEALAFTHEAEPVFLSRDYLAIAEDTGQIQAIGDRLLEVGLSRLARFVADGNDPGRLALNISATQLKDESFVPRVAAMLNRFGLSPNRLEFEIAENTLVDRGAKTVREALAALDTLGATIALDDFGTGATSLSHLTSFPISRLKIDPSFVRAIGTACESARIPGTIIDMAHNLGIGVIAAGVDQQPQFDSLAMAGCDFAQGELISKPLLDDAAIESYLIAREVMRTRDKVFLL